jgi:hypothetical protein
MWLVDTKKVASLPLSFELAIGSYRRLAGFRYLEWTNANDNLSCDNPHKIDRRYQNAGGNLSPVQKSVKRCQAP